MGKRVLQEILKEISLARYFSLIIGSSTDVSHTDLLAVALRFVSVSKACANERLVRVLSDVSHKAQGMEAAALNLLEELEQDLKPKSRQCFTHVGSVLRPSFENTTKKMSLLNLYHLQPIP
ncbi:hypothetical protein NPIL_77471 [Nephila pilipes]|uniref:Uncharacterized protein n=1 Tax=Nephila pilipes TaxID=299642 RepID=A0A8X6T9A7_NEPPI|nr:hypothetical protein NPIL_77471 [Nephila pilipes]